MKKLLAILMLLAACLTSRAQLNQITVTITNAPVSTSTLTIIGNTFNWTNAQPIGPVSVLITNTLPGDGTNLYNVVVQYLPQFGISVIQTNATNLIFTGIGLTGSVFSTVPGAAWATITSSSITTSSATNVVVPISSVNDLPSRTNTETQLANDLAQYATNPIPTNAVVLQTYTPTNGLFMGVMSNGVITNAQAISGSVSNLTNGTWTNPSFTNGQNFGNPFRSPGGGAGSEQFGSGASATANAAAAFGDAALASGSGSSAFGDTAFAIGAASAAFGDGSFATNTQSTAIGALSYAPGAYGTALGSGATSGDLNTTALGIGTQASNINATAIGAYAQALFAYSTAIGVQSSSTQPHQLMIGTSADFTEFPGGVLHDSQDTNITLAGTNRFGGVLIYPRFNNSSLANGANAGISTSTNRYVKLSGPTGAFSIAGIAGALPDKEVVLLNSTSQVMTISNDSGTDPVATNRIYTVVNATGGADIVGSNAITLLYDFSLTHWVVVGAR